MTQLFNKKSFDATKENMFFGESVNVARYDQQRYPFFEKLTERQISFFWTSGEVDLSREANDFNNKLSDHERHIFTANLKYQILLDSIQGRSPSMCLLPIISVPELESWVDAWTFEELIHSRSYTHIIRNIYTNPSVVFDTIVENEQIKARAESVCDYGDDLIEKVKVWEKDKSEENTKAVKKALYLYIVSVNILEGIRFYVSFACSFAFAERTLMEGNAKIIKLIARSEALHLAGTQYILNLWRSGSDDPYMAKLVEECEEEVLQMYRDAAQQEKDWAKYLFKDGSMIGLNENILNLYVEYVTNNRMQAIGLKPIFDTKVNPIPWVNAWLNSDQVQVAPQEAEISSYLASGTDNNLEEDEFNDFDL